MSVGMLLALTAGSLLPAALIMSGQIFQTDSEEDEQKDEDAYLPSSVELPFSRVNAAIMMFLYMAYLTLQIGTHKEEFDEEENVVETEQHLLVLTPHYVVRHHGRQRPAQRNLFCLKYCFRRRHEEVPAYHSPGASPIGNVEMVNGNRLTSSPPADQLSLSLSDDSQDPEDIIMPTSSSFNDSASHLSQRLRERRKVLRMRSLSYDEHDGIARSPARAPLDFVEKRPITRE
jgi:hypothetical protein